MATGENLPEGKPAEEPVPPAVEAVDLGPIGPSQRYEFTPDQERVIADLSGKMGFVGAFLLALTLILVIRLIVLGWRYTYFDANLAINALVFGCIAVWTLAASGAFAAVVTTVGRDVSHLMDALGSLRQMYSLLYWLLVIAIFSAAILLLRTAFFSRESRTSMANRHNHYEAAFEAYIRACRLPCVAVDEAKRAVVGDQDVKSPDFLLYPGRGANLVVEVKGKRGKTAIGRRAWENWVTLDDLDGLARWQTMFGPGFRALLCFVYAEDPAAFALPPGDGAFTFRNRLYRFWALELDDYIKHLRSRGPAWKAVAMARAEFRARVRPLEEWFPSSARLRPDSPRPRRLKLVKETET